MRIAMVGHSFQNKDSIYASFSAAYSCLRMFRMGFKPLYTAITVAYISNFK